jgi:hypothetical protein
LTNAPQDIEPSARDRPGFEREIFQRHLGELRQLDSSSDAGLILDGLLRGPFDFMRFRLVYDGKLKAAGNNNPRSAEKWALRRIFCPQLASLSVTHPIMRGVAITAKGLGAGGVYNASPHVSVDVDITSPHEKTKNALLELVDIGGYKFIPLVRRSLALICELDILFLRNDAPGSIVKSGGDLDNRIKTLFDGLRMPTPDELKVDKPDIQPFYCLLEDDSLISSFAVRTDRLLTDPARDEQRVLLVIDVKLTAIKLTAHNVGFLAD